jgi:hypothetical protein
LSLRTVKNLIQEFSQFIKNKLLVISLVLHEGKTEVVASNKNVKRLKLFENTDIEIKNSNRV